jgi:hypothetical protein
MGQMLEKGSLRLNKWLSRINYPNPQVQFVNSGHFALETHGEDIATAMLKFLSQSVKP